MDNNKKVRISEHFSELSDPRIDRSKLHALNDILVIAICAVICGAEEWTSIEEFGKAKQQWFRTFLDLPNGIPSHDTFGRVFARLDPEEFAQYFSGWIESIAQFTEGEVVAIDGKTLRRSFDKSAEKAAIHMVSAWASKNKILLGQIKTEEKSNEITAIPKLLEILEVTGCIVTIDAMGCQTKIASKIIEKDADYILALKGNQGTLHQEVELFFQDALSDEFRDIPYDFYESVDGDHGRIETRRVWCTSEIQWFEDRMNWTELKSFIMVESERIEGTKIGKERRFYISSLPGDNAQQCCEAIRLHWGVENSLHWILDVAFREDDCRIRKGNAAENFSSLRRIALSLLKHEKSAKVGVKTKRLKAGWDQDYLLRVLGI